MVRPRPETSDRPRELRRRVVLPARMRIGSAWSDACILNVSSRGMMIQSSRGVPQGSRVEVSRGDHVIVARVVWCDGARAGLQVDDRLPVEAILTLSKAPSLQLIAADSLHLDGHRHLRAHATSRSRARALEFATIGFVTISLSATALAMLEQAFAAPLALIEAALGR